MLATRRRREQGTEAGELFAEMELKFDLLRLGDLEAGLEREESRLAEEERFLREELSEGALFRPGALAQKVVLRCKVWWVEVRRGTLAERRQQLSLLEEEIRFALRVRGLRESG